MSRERVRRTDKLAEELAAEFEAHGLLLREVIFRIAIDMLDPAGEFTVLSEGIAARLDRRDNAKPPNRYTEGQRARARVEIDRILSDVAVAIARDDRRPGD